MKKQNQLKYHTFISYRHEDNKEQGRQWATWLHQAIETYEVPSDLVGETNGWGEEIPVRIYPIFRDEEELSADADLGKAIVNALDSTRLLIVLCSPRAVASTYVADEIDYFKKLGNSDRIIAVMIDGEPNASWDKGKLASGFKVEDECFPIPLQFKYDEQGNRTKKHTEPIAADFRINNNGVSEQAWTSIEAYRQYLKTTSGLNNKDIQHKLEVYQQQQHLMLLKIIAGILSVPLGELTQRDKEYQLKLERQKAKKLRHWLSAVFILAVVAIGAGVFANQQRDKAEALLNEVRENLNFMNFELRDVLKKYVPTTERVKVIERVDDLLERLQSDSVVTAEDQRAIFAALINKVDVILQNAVADTAEALPLTKKAHKIISSLVSHDPNNIEFQEDLSVSHEKLGNIQFRMGNTDAALSAYQASLSIREALVKRDPTNLRFQRSLSVSHQKLGNIQFRKGNFDAALTVYQAGLNIAEALVKRDPTNPGLQRSISISHEKLGNIQFRMGNFDAALTAYQANLNIAEVLVKLDLTNTQFQRDLSVVHEKLGDIQFRMGNTDTALTAYQASFSIREELVKHDLTNTQFQRDLSVAHEKLGGIQADLGNFDAALTAYQASLSISDVLAKRNPTNIQFQRGLSLSHNKVGDIQLRLGNIDAGSTAYQTSLGLHEALVKRDPTNTQFQRDLGVYYWKLYWLFSHKGMLTDALTSIEKFRDKFLWMKKNNLIRPDEKALIYEANTIILKLKEQIEKSIK